jgi:type I restriction enzyme M protein
MNMIIHDDGHTNVITEDGLLNSNEIAAKTTNTGFKYNHFDFIITNPPFGSSIKKSEKSYLGSYDFGKIYFPPIVGQKLIKIKVNNNDHNWC